MATIGQPEVSLQQPAAEDDLFAILDAAPASDSKDTALIANLKRQPSDRFEATSRRLSDGDDEQVKSARALGRKIAEGSVDEVAKAELVTTGGSEMSSRLVQSTAPTPQDLASALYKDVNSYCFGGSQNAFEEVSAAKQNAETARMIAVRETKLIATQAMLLGMAEVQMEKGDTLGAIQQMQAARLHTRMVPPWFMQSLETHLTEVVGKMSTMTEADLPLLEQTYAELHSYPPSSAQVDIAAPLNSLQGNDFLRRVAEDARGAAGRIRAEMQRAAVEAQYHDTFNRTATVSFERAASNIEGQIGALMQNGEYPSGPLTLRDLSGPYLMRAIQADEEIKDQLRNINKFHPLHGMLDTFTLINNPDFITRTATILLNHRDESQRIVFDEGMRRLSDLPPQEAVAAAERIIRRDISGVALGMLRGVLLYKSETTDGSYTQGNLPEIRRKVLTEVFKAVGAGRLEHLLRPTVNVSELTKKGLDKKQIQAKNDEVLRQRGFTDVQIQAKNAILEFRDSIVGNGNAFGEFKTIIASDMRLADESFQVEEQRRAQERAALIESSTRVDTSLELAHKLLDNLADDFYQLQVASDLESLGRSDIPKYITVSGAGSDRQLKLNSYEKSQLEAENLQLESQLAGELSTGDRSMMENRRLELAIKLTFYSQVEAQLIEFNLKRKKTSGVIGIGASAHYPYSVLYDQSQLPTSTIQKEMAERKGGGGPTGEMSYYDEIQALQKRYDELRTSGKASVEVMRDILQPRIDEIVDQLQSLHIRTPSAVLAAQRRGAMYMFSEMSPLTVLSGQKVDQGNIPNPFYKIIQR